jgi:hypothetical protein
MTDHHETWESRAVEVTRGNQTFLGCIINRMIGCETDAPTFCSVTTAHITSDGYLIADFQIAPDRPFLATRVGSLLEVRHSLLKLADKLRLNEADRKDMLEAMRQWIGSDDRVTG